MRIDALRLRAQFCASDYTHGGFHGSRLSGNERPAPFLRFLFSFAVESPIVHLQRRLPAETLSEQGALPSQSVAAGARVDVGFSSRQNATVALSSLRTDQLCRLFLSLTLLDFLHFASRGFCSLACVWREKRFLPTIDVDLRRPRFLVGCL
ncbi:UNVERIFIED_CONTAM: hypothetical protein HHA_252410 [Hammondia hammondi]|eukprot:XP_008888570.1 hypothetical protein HHA_252410 [Hammondia hammondi]